jgi:hypothetical protein
LILKALKSLDQNNDDNQDFSNKLQLKLIDPLILNSIVKKTIFFIFNLKIFIFK